MPPIPRWIPTWLFASRSWLTPKSTKSTTGLQGVASAVLADARTIPLIPQYTEIIPVLAEAINELATDPGADTQAVLDLAAEDVRFVMEAAGYYD